MPRGFLLGGEELHELETSVCTRTGSKRRRCKVGMCRCGVVTIHKQTCVKLRAPPMPKIPNQWRQKTSKEALGLYSSKSSQGREEKNCVARNVE